ncbi:MAG: CvpA family protein [Elusimicrobia bacterium]|nr:CvpA family protein [Elusimicrobiota bacterium]
MNLDLWLLAALGLFAAIGFYTGAIQQVSHWIGLAAAYFCAKPVAALLAPVIAERMGWPPPLVVVGVSAVSMPVVLIVVTLIARGIINAIIPGKQRNIPDRVAGIFLGAGKVAVIAWVALAAVLAFEGPLAQHFPGAGAALDASSAAAFTRKHSLFESALPAALDRFRAAAAMRDDPRLAEALRDDPALRAIFNDPALKLALEKGDTSALLENPQLRKLLADPELVKKIEEMTPR